MSKVKIPMLKRTMSCGHHYPVRKEHTKMSQLLSKNMFKPVEPDSVGGGDVDDGNIVRPKVREPIYRSKWQLLLSNVLVFWPRCSLCKVMQRSISK